MEPVQALLECLPATKTFARRTYQYLSAEFLGSTDGRDATLVIEQAKSTKIDAKVEHVRYAVEERGRKPFEQGRVFFVMNENEETAPDTLKGYQASRQNRTGEVYETTIGPVNSCTCDGHRLGKAECKHIAALADVIRKGGLPVRELAAVGGA